MKLVVCALADLAGQAAHHQPDAVVTLLGPDQAVPPVPRDPPRLVLSFNDVTAPREGLVAPDETIIARLLAFTSGLDPDATLLLHCWMGISRSPAAAFILACARAPHRPEMQIARSLRQRSPSATPNPLLVRLADDHMGRRGRMSAAISAIGRGGEASTGAPFTLDI